jgi:hypothetical protein
VEISNPCGEEEYPEWRFIMPPNSKTLATLRTPLPIIRNFPQLDGSSKSGRRYRA